MKQVNCHGEKFGIKYEIIYRNKHQSLIHIIESPVMLSFSQHLKTTHRIFRQGGKFMRTFQRFVKNILN